MATKQKVTIAKTVTRERKTGGDTGYKKCPQCKGTGRVKK